MSQSSSGPSSPPEQDRGSGSMQSTMAGVFTPPAHKERNLPVGAWAAAGLVIFVLVAGLIVAGRTHTRPSPNEVLSLDTYAASLSLTDLVMSESVSLSGGKSTFIDGHIRNNGSKVVTGATVQVFFRNDEGMPPQIETLALPLVRTREPYVDTQSVSASPIKPGEEREFRLILESLPGNWNTHLPDIHVVHVVAR